MLLEQLRIRLRAEYNALRGYLATANITAVEILDRAYEIVWKEEIVCLFEGMTDCRYSDEVLCNLTEYLTQRPLEHETIGDQPGNDGKPREHKGCGELNREEMRGV